MKAKNYISVKPFTEHIDLCNNTHIIKKFTVYILHLANLKADQTQTLPDT